MSRFEQAQKVLGGRRITIFNEACKTLGIREGSFVIVRLEEGGLKVIPAEVRPRKANVRKGE